MIIIDSRTYNIVSCKLPFSGHAGVVVSELISLSEFSQLLSSSDTKRPEVGTE